VPRANLKRVVTLNLSDPAYDFVFRFIEVAYPGMPISAGVRELLLVAAGTDPLDAAAHETRRATRHMVQAAMRQKLLANLGEVLTQLHAEEAMDAAINAAKADDSNTGTVP
jgi:hypothetical protein